MIAKDMVALGAARSQIFELFEFGKKRAAVVGKENVLDFSIGNPSVPAPPQVQEAIREILNTMNPVEYHSYTGSTGDPAVKTAIAENLNQRFQTSYKAENLFLTCGAAASLNIVFKAIIADPKDEILLFAPYFPEYLVYVEGHGAKPVVVPPREDMCIDTEALAERMTAHTKAIVLNSPNNPSGVIYPKENLEEVARILREKSQEYGQPIYIITDEPYRELVYTGQEVVHMPDLYDNTIVCYSWSKSLSLAGERIGYILLPDSIENKTDVFTGCLGAARVLGYVCAPSLFQKVVAKCVDVEPDLSLYRKNRELLYDGLRELGYKMAQPDGAFYLFVEAPGMDAAAFCKRAMDFDLLLVPGDSFGVPTHLRISFCVETEKVHKAMPIFARLMEGFRCTDIGICDNNRNNLAR